MRWRPKFSLLSLLLLSLLSGGVFALYWHRAPWFVAYTLHDIPPDSPVAFSADGRLALGVMDNKKSPRELALVDLSTGQVTVAPTTCYCDIRVLALAPDGSRAAVWCDAIPRRYDLPFVAGKPFASAQHSSWTPEIKSMSYDMWLIDLRKTLPPKRVARVQGRTPPQLCFSADGKMVFTSELNVYDAYSGVPIPLGLGTNNFTESNRYVFDEARDAAEETRSFVEFGGFATQFYVSGVVDPNGKFLLTRVRSGRPGQHQLWDLTTQTKCGDPKLPTPAHPHSTIFIGSERLLQKVGNVLRLCDARTGKELSIFGRPDVAAGYCFMNREGVNLNQSNTSCFLPWIASADHFTLHLEEPGDAPTPNRSWLSDLNENGSTPDGNSFLLRTGKSEVLCILNGHGVNKGIAGIAPGEETILLPIHIPPDVGLQVCKRRRPEQWWGYAWLPAFWAVAIFAPLLAWSLRRDWRFAAARRAAKRSQAKSTEADRTESTPAKIA